MTLADYKSCRGGAGGSVAPTNRNAPPPKVLVPKNSVRRGPQTLTGVFNITRNISCPQTTPELPKKHQEAGPPEQLPTDALSQIDYGHSRHCEGCKEVYLWV